MNLILIDETFYNLDFLITAEVDDKDVNLLFAEDVKITVSKREWDFILGDTGSIKSIKSVESDGNY